MSIYYSIIVPAYNASKYIRDCIDSVLSQNYSNFELIIVDDGSTDETKSIVYEYSSDTRIKYVYQNNTGVSSARNKGILESNGDYICFVDADDVVSPNFLKTFDDILNKKRIDIVYCENYDFYNDSLPDFAHKMNNEIKSVCVFDYDYC